MHSWPMMVESMSATSSRLQRGSSGWTTTSRPSSDPSAHRAVFTSPREAEVGRIALVDPVAEARLRIDLAQQAERPVDQPVIEPSGCYQRRNGHPIPNPPLALIAGPTASGKSALALALAERTSGVIVNADSAQVYRDLPILSAAPTADESRGRSIGCTAFWTEPWPAPPQTGPRARGARSPISMRKDELPILVGGTGPVYPDSARWHRAGARRSTRKSGGEVREAPREENRARLAELDPDAAARLKPQTRPGSRARWRSSSRPAARLPTGSNNAKAGSTIGLASAADPASATRLALRPLRSAFCSNGRARRGRGSEGACWRAISIPDLPIMRGIGVREIAAFLAARFRSRRRSRRVSRPRGGTQSGNIPGSHTSLRRNGRASQTRWMRQHSPTRSNC